MTRIQGHILTPTGFVRGELIVDDTGHVAQVVGQPLSEAHVLDAALPIVIPGFIDLHVHGGGGCDVMDGDNAIATVASQHARHGTTALLGTTMTAPIEDLEKRLPGWRGHAPTVRSAARGYWVCIWKVPTSAMKNSAPNLHSHGPSLPPNWNASMPWHRSV